VADDHTRVRDLAVAILDSFEKLEVVVQLEQEGKPMTLEALVAALRVEKAALVEALAALAQEQVIAASDSGYELVEGGTWSGHVHELYKLYQADRIQVVTIMSEAALKRLRMQANRAFADAFVIRAKKRGDE
jgi:hypothetical protein